MILSKLIIIVKLCNLKKVYIKMKLAKLINFWSNVWKHTPKNTKIFKNEYSYKLNFIVKSLYVFKKETKNIIEINQALFQKLTIHVNA